ncbi:MAG: DUF3309 family protein [Roseinatronobacter sp.]|nr:MAG: DUF3309 family protein [Roseinatronobacter sp.]
MHWFWVLVLMTLLVIALLPIWPHMRDRDLGYWPSGAAFAFILMILVLWHAGWVAIWSPAPVPVVR